MRFSHVCLIHGLCLLAPTLLGATGCERVREQDAAVEAADGGGGDGTPASQGGSGGKVGEAGSGSTRDAGKSGSSGAGRDGHGSTGGKGGGSATQAGAGAAGTGTGAVSGGAAGTAGAPAGTGGSAAGNGGSGAGASSGRCGTRGGVECAADQFCNREPDAECGATDRGGVCEAKPQICPTIYAPVCGCDDRTHSNDCTAHSAGVSVKREGMCNPDECEAAGGRPVHSNGANVPECESGEQSWNISGGREQAICCWMPEVGGRTCGGIASLECDSGQFCNYEESAGGQGCDGTISDAAGVCQMQPQGCTKEYVPVCGCDRKTYGNRCTAHAAGMSVLHEGSCTESDCKYLGGRVAYGLGPAPMCNANETPHGSVVPDSGAMPFEGALCCLP